MKNFVKDLDYFLIFIQLMFIDKNLYHRRKFNQMIISRNHLRKFYQMMISSNHLIKIYKKLIKFQLMKLLILWINR
jgi:hypothetical protein